MKIFVPVWRAYIETKTPNRALCRIIFSPSTTKRLNGQAPRWSLLLFGSSGIENLDYLLANLLVLAKKNLRAVLNSNGRWSFSAVTQLSVGRSGCDPHPRPGPPAAQHKTIAFPARSWEYRRSF